MAKKGAKKVSINSLDKAMREQEVKTTTCNWNGIEIQVVETIGLRDMLEFVNNAVESCFGEDGSYMPEAMDFAVKSNILEKYSNVSLPANLEHRYDLICRTDLVDAVVAQIDREQLFKMEEAIECKVEHLCRKGEDEVRNRLEKLVVAFEKMQELMEEMFSGVTPEDVGKMVGSVGDDGLDMNRLVQAYLEQTRAAAEEQGAE